MAGPKRRLETRSHVLLGYKLEVVRRDASVARSKSDAWRDCGRAVGYGRYLPGVDLVRLPLSRDSFDRLAAASDRCDLINANGGRGSFFSCG